MGEPPNVELRERLMRLIAATIEQRGLKQREAASLFGTTQPRISEIVRGKVDEFTIDSLVNMLAAAEITAPIEWRCRTPRDERTRAPDPVVEAYKRDVDRTLLREALERTPTERVQALARLQRLAREARSARGRRRR